MRQFLVGYSINGGNQITHIDTIILKDDERANPKTFAKIIDFGINHYNGHSCQPHNIKYWSLIEEDEEDN